VVETPVLETIVRERKRSCPYAAFRGCYAIRADIVPERSEWDAVYFATAGRGVQRRVVRI
jgi:hypothetical protein